MTSRHSTRTRAQLLAGLLAVGCGADSVDTSLDGATSNGSLTLARDIQPIFDMYCVGCHAEGAGDRHGDPHFTRDSSKAALSGTSACTSGGVRVRFVAAGAPEESFLLYKLGAETKLTIDGSTCEQTMPYGADVPLAQSDPAAVMQIEQWILDGAR